MELRTGLRIENQAGIDAGGTITISDGGSHRLRRHRGGFPRKSAEQTSYAVPMRRAEAQSCAARSWRGLSYKQEACKSGCWSPRLADDSQNSGRQNWRKRRSQPKADDWWNWCAPSQQNCLSGSGFQNLAGHGRHRLRCPEHSKSAWKCWGGPMSLPKPTAWKPVSQQKADDSRRAAPGVWSSFPRKRQRSARCSSCSRADERRKPREWCAPSRCDFEHWQKAWRRGHARRRRPGNWSDSAKR